MYGEKEIFTGQDLRECAELNSCPLVMWEHTSGGYWFTVKFVNDDMNFHFIKIHSLLDDLERNGLSVVSNKYEIDSDGEDDWIEYEIEVMY